MNTLKELIESYAIDVRFPEVSGFEILETLDLRSEIAAREHELTPEERAALEEADRHFFEHAPQFYASISTIADLAEIRKRAKITPSHWWWYLDELVRVAA